MFFHMFKYKLVSIVRERAIAFWTLLFPLILGTMFYFAFGSIDKIGETMDPVSIVLVDEVGIADYFLGIGEKLSEEAKEKFSGIDFSGSEGKTMAQLESILSELGEEDLAMLSEELFSSGEGKTLSPQLRGFILMQLVFSLSEEGGDQLFCTYTAGREKAVEMLKEDKVKAVVSITQDGPKLEFAGSGLDQTVAKSFFDQYLQSESMMLELMQENGGSQGDWNGLFGQINSQGTYLQETTLGKAALSNITYYFYALIAMACLYGVFLGTANSLRLQADMSMLAARRSVSASRKLTAVSADFLASVLFHWCCLAVLLLYLTLVLDIDLGDEYGRIALTCMAGSMIGISFGQFLGAISGLKEKTKEGIAIGVTLLLCFLGDLMANGIKHSIELTCPIINRLNPAVLIADSFYCLNIYDNYEKFTIQIVTMGVIAGVLLTASVLLLRRKKYACI